MPLVVVNRDEERKRLFEETAMIRARIAKEEQEDRMRRLLNEGNELLEQAERAKLGGYDFSGL